MISNDSVSLVDRAFRAIWNGTRGTDLKALFADGFEFRNLSSLDDVTDLSGLRQRIIAVRSVHPRGHLRVEDMVNSGDLVSVWWSFGNNGRSHFPRTRGASQPAVMDGTCMFRLEGSRIIEMWELGGQLMREPLAQ